MAVDLSHAHAVEAGAAGLPARLANRIGQAAEIVAALLTGVEILILLAGIVARYCFGAPLIWSDELAWIIFLWLAMFGAVAAFHRGRHMRMTLLSNTASPRVANFLELVSFSASVAFLLFVLWPSWRYAMIEASVLTPALEISTLWRAAALPVGFALILILSILRFAASERPRDYIEATVAVATVAIAVWLARGTLSGLGNANIVVFFVLGVGGMVAAGVPIAFVFGLASIGFIVTMTKAPVIVVVGRLDEGMSHIINLAIPLFIFLGLLIEMTGMARAMVQFLASLLGHVRGGLSYVLLGGMYLVSGISGSKIADMAAVAPVLFPEMKKRGAKGGELVAQLSSSGAMAETIPPSLVLIVIGSACGISIAALFTGGLMPALVAALALCVVVWLRSRKDDLSGVRRATGRETGKALVVALPALILPFVIRTAVIEGVATATEVSTIGIAYSVVVGLLVYRKFDWKRVIPMLVETASLSGAVLLIIGTATAMAWALTQSGFSHQLAALITGLPGGAMTFLAISIVLFIVLGAMLEGLPAIIVFGPLMFPIARQLGVHDVQYATVVILAMGIGLFAPPIGVGYYAACAIGRVAPEEGVRPIWAYLLALFAALILVAVFPWISIGFLGSK